MSIQAWEKERQRVFAEEALLKIEAEEKAGTALYTPVEEVFTELDRIIDETEAAVL